ncbi:MAG: hypothetical protein WCW26_05620 [Candidatus Buchananbacteria bacterium]
MPFEKPDISTQELANNDLGFFKLKTFLEATGTKPVHTENKEIDGLPTKIEYFIMPDGNTIVIKTQDTKPNKNITFELRDKNDELIIWQDVTHNLDKIEGYLNSSNRRGVEPIFYEILGKLKGRLPSNATIKKLDGKYLGQVYFKLLDGEIIINTTSKGSGKIERDITIKDKDGKIIFFEKQL